MIFYLDTSAFLKLLIEEAESTAMRAWFLEDRDCWSSQLLVTEALRAARRLQVPADSVLTTLATVSMVIPSSGTFLTAGTLGPPALRSLDALHLATALELADDLEAVVTYDDRLVEATLAAGLPIMRPS